MGNTKEQVINFLDKCEEVKNCKFIMASTKIKDLLKCIVNSPELYRLFETVTKDFDYTQEKSKCLIIDDKNGINKNCVVLPHTVGQRLAFIFCLLVEFDRNTINLNDFLQIYFADDGSYYSSYRAFCKKIIGSLEDLIRQVFKDALVDEDEDGELVSYSNPERSNLLSEITLAISCEKQFISHCRIPEEEKEGAYKMLDELQKAVKCGNEQNIDALICGYNYFVLYNKCVSDGIAPLIESLSDYEKTL